MSGGGATGGGFAFGGFALGGVAVKAAAVVTAVSVAGSVGYVGTTGSSTASRSREEGARDGCRVDGHEASTRECGRRAAIGRRDGQGQGAREGVGACDLSDRIEPGKESAWTRRQGLRQAQAFEGSLDETDTSRETGKTGRQATPDEADTSRETGKTGRQATPDEARHRAEQPGSGEAGATAGEGAAEEEPGRRDGETKGRTGHKALGKCNDEDPAGQHHEPEGRERQESLSGFTARGQGPLTERLHFECARYGRAAHLLR